MGFLYSAFIENTSEAREWLESIGYPSVCVDENEKTIFTREIKGKWFYFTNNVIDIFPKYFVNCRGNIQLFRLITSCRTDTDHGQMFTNGKDWYLCPNYGSFADFIYSEFDGYCGDGDIKSFHKATLEELIKHFKK